MFSIVIHYNNCSGQKVILQSPCCVQGILYICYLHLYVFLDIAQMYVTGQLAETEHVIIDIGTGYYIEKVSVKL